jgi:uncharacterized membrane protein YoaT (DUF817 family)
MNHFPHQLRIFTLKQSRCALFGGILLFFLILTKYIDTEAIFHLHRYDFLFLIAVLTQILMILFKLEDWKEVVVIATFHVAAMVMELYKTAPSVGAWAYPEPAILAIGTVPLFTGFLYSSVGSYIARAWRINEFRFENIPSRSALWIAATCIYANFFTDSMGTDVRYLILAYLIIIFWKTKLRARITDRVYAFHPLVTNAALAFFVWIAEQIGTFARAWIYPAQAAGWKPVSFHMFTSWYLLLIFSFVLITILYGDMFRKHTFRLMKKSKSNAR